MKYWSGKMIDEVDCNEEGIIPIGQRHGHMEEKIDKFQQYDIDDAQNTHCILGYAMKRLNE